MGLEWPGHVEKPELEGEVGFGGEGVGGKKRGRGKRARDMHDGGPK